MDEKRAKKILSKISMHGCIIITSHCRAQMKERNVTTHDILNVLIWGNIKKFKKSTKHNNEWKIEIEGQDFDGDQLTVHAAVNEDERTVIITVY
jgi:hypothetical protein